MRFTGFRSEPRESNLFGIVRDSVARRDAVNRVPIISTRIKLSHLYLDDKNSEDVWNYYPGVPPAGVAPSPAAITSELQLQ